MMIIIKNYLFVMFLANLYEPLEIENVENEDNLNNLRIKKGLKNKKLKYN